MLSWPMLSYLKKMAPPYGVGHKVRLKRLSIHRLERHAPPNVWLHCAIWRAGTMPQNLLMLFMAMMLWNWLINIRSKSIFWVDFKVLLPISPSFAIVSPPNYLKKDLHPENKHA